MHVLSRIFRLQPRGMHHEEVRVLSLSADLYRLVVRPVPGVLSR